MNHTREEWGLDARGPCQTTLSIHHVWRRKKIMYAPETYKLCAGRWGEEVTSKKRCKGVGV
jgi:hypothetical protein